MKYALILISILFANINPAHADRNCDAEARKAVNTKNHPDFGTSSTGQTDVPNGIYVYWNSAAEFAKTDAERSNLPAEIGVKLNPNTCQVISFLEF